MFVARLHNEGFDLLKRINLAKNVADAIQHFHQYKIVLNQNVLPSSFMMSPKETAILMDFSNANYLDSANHLSAKDVCGISFSPPRRCYVVWQASEVLFSQKLWILRLSKLHLVEFGECIGFRVFRPFFLQLLENFYSLRQVSVYRIRWFW